MLATAGSNAVTVKKKSSLHHWGHTILFKSNSRVEKNTQQIQSYYLLKFELDLKGKFAANFCRLKALV